MLACAISNNEEMLDYLINAGADVNAVNNLGMDFEL